MKWNIERKIIFIDFSEFLIFFKSLYMYKLTLRENWMELLFKTVKIRALLMNNIPSYTNNEINGRPIIIFSYVFAYPSLSIFSPLAFIVMNYILLCFIDIPPSMYANEGVLCCISYRKLINIIFLYI